MNNPTDHDASITIRPARIDDIPGIAHVHVQSWRSTYAGIVPDEYLERLNEQDAIGRWSRWLVEGEDRLNATVALRDGRIIGFATGGRSRDTNAHYTGEIYAIYLLEEEQRNGVGRRLLRSVARNLHSAGHHSILVWVLQRNPSREFYRSLGGELLETKSIAIGGAELLEEGYGWKDVSGLIDDTLD